ncbi:cupin domain-containing protein [Petropleomorpha daqingensis]|uniref:Mannose-6-phosphate isomerase-like protein (Cupin superfamily) n=1 Tax=Petropleomorpha daqingensis TaxID=2026353 RepID=A0A853CGQ6_9ACTN|nr:cupin domain-containing protein [Petropleomorpha daqingensis]NYJ05732.1 mannose-6-phosphate isomerase-like protein (cupin superfamily) [Petropleomorpha daqingensis]
MTVPSTARAGLVPAGDAVPLLEGPLGALLLAGRDDTAGGPAFVVHDLAPRALGSPVHTHTHEDEWSFVLSGAVGVEIGGRSSIAWAGDLVLKPRGVPHAFWNAGDEPARLLEVITPGGFEQYFAALGEVLAVDGPPDLDRLAEVAARFDLEVDPTSVPRLAQTHGLVLA